MNGKRSLNKWEEEFVQMMRGVGVCTNGKRSLNRWEEEFKQMGRGVLIFIGKFGRVFKVVQRKIDLVNYS